jgi:hypothetical protein
MGNNVDQPQRASVRFLDFNSVKFRVLVAANGRAVPYSVPNFIWLTSSSPGRPKE